MPSPKATMPSLERNDAFLEGNRASLERNDAFLEGIGAFYGP
jgi:hypothetical protein